MPLARAPRRTPAGFTLVEVAIIVAVLAIIAAIAIPRLLGGRKEANEAEAIATLRSIYTAEQTFRDHDRDRDGRNDYADRMTALAGLLPPELTESDSPERMGYRFFLLEPEDGGSGGFRAFANPVSPGRTGERRFFVDGSGVVRASTTGQAGPADAPVGR
jgi:type II secretory pathway pseudopilin PulG